MISNPSADPEYVTKNLIFNALYKRVIKAKQNKEKFKIYVFTPLLPGFEGDPAGDAPVLKV